MSTNNECYNSDELVAPAWLNAEFLTKILHNCEGKSSELELKHFTILPATKMGDHYASVMFRVKLEYSVDGANKSRSTIIKTMPEIEGHKKEFLGQTSIFETEIGMYTEVLPRFEQILRDAGDETVLKAPCLYHQLSPHKLIVFEDIVPHGYDVVRDRDAFSDDELKAVLVKLAKLQAVSYKIIKEEPKYLEQYRDNMFTLPNISEDPFITDGIKHFIATYKSHPKISKYVPYFEKLQTQLLSKCRDSFMEYCESPQPDGCYVLCHGDLNMKNMMFKRDEGSGKLVDALLIDFQGCQVASNALDLINIKCFLLNAEMRENWPSYLPFYLTQFNETLEKIGFKGPKPTMSRMSELLMHHKYYELFTTVTFLPMRYAMSKGNIDLAEMLTSSDFRKSTYANKGLIAELEKLLPKYEQLGYFADL